MKVSGRRLALLGAGVSFAALSVSSPANVAYTGASGVSHVDQNDPNGDTLTICLVDDDCVFGIDGDGTGLVAATVADVPNGQIEQRGTSTTGDVVLHLVNDGSAEIGAHANAATSSGFASANANILNGIFHSGTGVGNVAIDLSNDGSLLIDAVAHADPGSTANAHATVEDGVAQFAGATGGAASLKLSNGGSLNISAVAHGVGSATTSTSFQIVGPSGTTSTTSHLVVHPVRAGIEAGISQNAFGRDASASLANSGSIAIGAHAEAQGNVAFASADVDHGVFQFASGADAASDTLKNTGSFNIGADANATGETGAGAARAAVTHGIQQVAHLGLASAALDNSGSIDIAAYAAAKGEDVQALAQIFTAVSQNVQSVGSDAKAELTNSGTIQLVSNAKATAVQSNALTSMAFGGTAAGEASVTTGIREFASAFGGNADVSFTNSGKITVVASGHAVAEMTGAATRAGNARATGWASNAIYQETFANSGDANIGFQNSGQLSVAGLAQANGANALAHGAVQTAVIQIAQGSSGHAHDLINNSGAIGLEARATANGSAGFASASAAAHHAVEQLASYKNGDASADFANSGSIDVESIASVNAATGAGAFAYGAAVDQSVLADGFGLGNVDNQSAIRVRVIAKANTGSGLAQSEAKAGGVAQVIDGGSEDLASLNNEGTLDVGAFATLTGSFIHARGVAVGVLQRLFGGTAEVTNSGTIDVTLSEKLSATAVAQLMAQATGVTQSGSMKEASFNNSGILSVAAQASAEGGSYEGIQEVAAGYQVDSSGVDVAVKNSGRMDVTAKAASLGSVGVLAKGMELAANGSTAATIGDVAISGSVENSGSLSVEATGEGSNASVGALGIIADVEMGAPDGNPVIGAALFDASIVNSGDLHVVAKALGGGSFAQVTGSGTTARTILLNGSTANAGGIYIGSGANRGVVTNSGSINVDAVTAKGGPATAYGIRATDNGSGLPPTSADVFTINNSGDIIVRQSTDGGKTWQRGTAIDVASAPNASVINLLDGGKIYGNIDVKDGDVINVTGGTTLFDGIVNPECVGAADLNACGQGALNINNGGRLVLQDPRFTGDAAMYDGSSYAFVNTLDMRAPSDGAAGTISFGLEPASGGAQAAGSYSQVFADTANLAGTLEAWFAPKDGLFADSYSWDNVIDANTRNGEFDQCALGGAYAGSPLLQLSCSYDNSGNIDLALTRVAFDKVAGLNRNAAALGTVIEGKYADLTGGASALAVDASTTSGFASVVSDLFRLDSAADYNSALNMLGGSSYANYLQSFGALGVHSNELVDRGTACEDPTLAGSALGCRNSRVRVWGQLDYQSRHADGDVEAGSISSKNSAEIAGVDVSVDNSLLVGFDGAALSNHLRDRQFGDTLKADGYQVGVYGVYDPGNFYLKGMAGYSRFDGDSKRRIDMVPLGGTFSSTVKGDPDVSMWTLGLHGGYRREAGKESLFTAYANLDYADAKLGGFAESNVAGDQGAELQLSGGKSRHLYLTSGLKLAGRIGGLVPEVNLGYRYRFGNSRTQVGVNALGSADANFDVVSASQKRGALLAGLSLGGKVGPVDVRLAVEGEYNGHVSSRGGNLKIALPLGGHSTAATAP